MTDKITPTLLEEIDFNYTRASGPGGQNVNKVSTAVELRVNVTTSPSLTDDVRARLMRLAGQRLTQEGVLILFAQRFRSQERNRADALDRLAKLLAQASKAPKARRATKPTLASQTRRLTAKNHRATTKAKRNLTKNLSPD
jgi:ribosome-associated protein